jgi:hypothetical protein
MMWKLLLVKDKNTNSLFSGLVLAIIFFCYIVNLQYNTSCKEDMIWTILNMFYGSKEMKSFEEDWEGHYPKMG